MEPTAGRPGYVRQVGLAVLVVGVAVAVDWPAYAFDPWVFLEITHVAASVALVVGGFRLAARPGQQRNGRLLMTAGGLYLLTWVAWTGGPIAVTAWLCSSLVGLCLAWLLLRYPNDRVAEGWDRRFVIGAFAIVLGLRVLETITWDPAFEGDTRSQWWPTLFHSKSLHTVVMSVMLLGTVGVGLAFIALVIRRHRRVRGLGRRQAVPLLVAGLAGGITFGLTDNIMPLIVLLWAPSAGTTLDHTQGFLDAIALFAVVAAFAVAALLERLQRSRVAELLNDVDAEHDPGALQRSLRSVLADPDLLVVFREQRDDPWVDVSGEAIDPPGDDVRRLVPVYEVAGVALAALLVDPGVTRQVDLLSAVVRASRLGLDNARLKALAQARLEEVSRSRQRLASVAADERRRLERDLHDGAQQQLLSVAAGVASARAATDDPVMKQRLDDVRDGLRAALGELRDLANGIHPAILTQSGLGAAVESAVDRLGLAARLTIEPTRWPPAVESAAYFVTSEALANAVKHAGAAIVEVSAVAVGPDLRLVISDDGSGGATASPGHGGLTGIRDRVAALGGTVAISSSAGEGTTIAVTLPCA